MNQILINDPEKLKKNAKRMLKTVLERGGQASLSSVQAGFAACYGYPDWNALLGSVGKMAIVVPKDVPQKDDYVLGLTTLAQDVREALEEMLVECLHTKKWLAVEPTYLVGTLSARDAADLVGVVGGFLDRLAVYVDESGNPRNNKFPAGTQYVCEDMVEAIRAAVNALTNHALDKGLAFRDFALGDYISSHHDLKVVFGDIDENSHACDNCCYFTDNADDLVEIRHIHSRVEPGGVMPSGECPMCGALAYPAKEA